MERVLKGDWQSMVGRTINAVVVCSSEAPPECQVYLVFADGSNFEIYSHGIGIIAGGNRVYSGDVAQLLRRMSANRNPVVYTTPTQG